MNEPTPVEPPPPSPANEPPPPPAAKIVIQSVPTDRELQLDQEIKTERESHAATQAEKKQRESRIAELEDELHRLKQIPAPAPPRSKSKPAPITFFEEED